MHRPRTGPRVPSPACSPRTSTAPRVRGRRADDGLTTGRRRTDEGGADMARVSVATRWQLLRGILTERPLLLMFVVWALWAAGDAAVFLTTSVVAFHVGGVHA